MRKLLAIAAAIAVIGGLAFAMLTDKEVLSFSEPNLNTRVENSMPPNQAQPQDFVGEGSQFYYFGPDFMCQIVADTTVSCFGSDEHNVVSDTPDGTGFTYVDGGDTYAYAYQQATQFNYCWGSITRSPTTNQPTATPEPTSTPEPTATALPPGVTPEPTATSAPAATPETDPCEIILHGNVSLPYTQTGSWLAECVYPFDLEDIADGDRYYRWIGFVPTLVESSWVATLESDEDTVMLLWELNTEMEQLDFVEMNDDGVPGNTNSRIEWTPTQGQLYVLDLTTYNANTLGDFTLTIETGTASPQNSAMEQSIMPSDFSGAIPFERRQ